MTTAGGGSGSFPGAGPAGVPVPAAGGESRPASARTPLDSGSFSGVRPGGDGHPPRRLGWLRRFGRVWGFALFLIAVAIVFRRVAMPFVLAIFVAYVLAPLVARLAAVRVASRTIPRWIAVALIYVGVLAGLALFVGVAVPRLAGDFSRLAREAPTFFRRANEEWVPKAGAWLERYVGKDPPEEKKAAPNQSVLPPPAGVSVVAEGPGRWVVQLDHVTVQVRPGADGQYSITARAEPPEEGDEPNRFSRAMRGWMRGMVESSRTRFADLLRVGQAVLAGAFSFLATFIVTMMVAGYLLVDLPRIHGFLRSLVPAAHRAVYDDVLAGFDRGLAGVVRGQLLICLLNGVLTWIGLAIFDVKYALLLALLAGTMSLIPIFGSILSSIPIVVMALVSTDTGLAVGKGAAVLGWIIGIHLLEANLFNPKIMGTAARIHPVVVVFALVAGEMSYGLVGALLAVPVVSMVQTVFVYFRSRWRAA